MVLIGRFDAASLSAREHATSARRYAPRVKSWTRNLRFATGAPARRRLRRAGLLKGVAAMGRRFDSGVVGGQARAPLGIRSHP